MHFSERNFSKKFVLKDSSKSDEQLTFHVQKTPGARGPEFPPPPPFFLAHLAKGNVSFWRLSVNFSHFNLL